MLYKTISTKSIKALGSLLSSYETDLLYIAEFQKWKESGFSNINEFASKTSGSFKAFINEFRVARNIRKDYTYLVLEKTQEWVSTQNVHDVDGFAEFLNDKDLTHQKIMTSLASKILMLNNPWEILPIDSLVKASLEYNGNKYIEFKYKLEDYIKNNETDFLYELSSINLHLSAIEVAFKKQLNNIEKIRFNRYVDKTLWVGGRK